MHRYASAAAGMIAMATMCGVASAQGIVEGNVYTFHSRANGGCPALDWHIVVGPNNTLAGMIAWDDMKAMARATGNVDPRARTFKMQAREVGGQGRTASIDGTVRQDGWLVATIKGPNVACQEIRVGFSSPSSSPSGGGG